MESKTSDHIFREIDEILATIGYTDYEAFRGVVQKASILFVNLATWSTQVAAISRADIVALVQEKSQPEQQRVVNLLSGLRESLPIFGDALIKAAVQVLPLDRGGRPTRFKDRDTMRQACNMVLMLVANGKTEAQAKRMTAKEFEVGYQTMHRTWKKRQDLMDLSFEEFFTRFLKSLSEKGTPAIPESGSAQSPEKSA